MTDHVIQRSIEIRVDLERPNLIDQVRVSVERDIGESQTPIRFAVTASSGDRWTCELATIPGKPPGRSIFDFERRSHEDADSFNVVVLVPTGIGAVVGGHAGDAMPVATLLASVCETLITHPNVLNASDIIQIPSNALYVEGSVISQLMMGMVGLYRRRNNRLLVLVQEHKEEVFTNAAINSVNAARASYGLNATVVMVDRRFTMKSEYSESDSAAGRIQGIAHIYELLDARLGQFDAVAITSVIDLPIELHKSYYRLVDDVVNPWGGVEAMLTHAISFRYGVPAAHAPMLESKEVADADFGVVDSRMAAEVISVAYLQSVLRGLQKSPAVSLNPYRTDRALMYSENVSCMVIPDGCIGLPTLAALQNDIPVVAVQGNTNLMRNDLDLLPWRPMQLHRAENYLEAAGIVAALRAGIDPLSATRPLYPASVECMSTIDRAESTPVWSNTNAE